MNNYLKHIICGFLYILISHQSFAQTAEINTIQSEINSLTNQLNNLHSINANYLEIRKLKIILDEKKKRLEQLLEDRVGIDRPIENGNIFLDNKWEEYKKYSTNFDLNKKKYHEAVLDKLYKFNGYVEFINGNYKLFFEYETKKNGNEYKVFSKPNKIYIYSSRAIKDEDFLKYKYDWQLDLPKEAGHWTETLAINLNNIEMSKRKKYTFEGILKLSQEGTYYLSDYIVIE